MTVPDYQNFLLPLLQLLKDGQEHPICDTYEILANQSQLTEEDRQQQLPSGQQKTYINRIGWAKTHLKKPVYSTIQNEENVSSPIED